MTLSFFFFFFLSISLLCAAFSSPVWNDAFLTVWQILHYWAVGFGDARDRVESNEGVSESVSKREREREREGRTPLEGQECQPSITKRDHWKTIIQLNIEIHPMR